MITTRWPKYLILTLALSLGIPRPLLADVPVHYFCGGTIEYSMNQWWEKSSPASGGTERRRIATPPPVCPAVSRLLTVKGGIGDGPLTGRVKAAGEIDHPGTHFYSVTPTRPFGHYGVLGQFLGRVFGGPSYGPHSEDIEKEFNVIRTYSRRMVEALKKDHAHVRREVATIERTADAEVAEWKRRGADTRGAAHNTIALLTVRLSERPAFDASALPNALGAVLDALARGGAGAAIRAAIPPQHLRPEGGAALFAGLDHIRETAFASRGLTSARLQFEHNKIMTAVGVAPNEAARQQLQKADLAIAAAARFRGDSGAPYAEALLEEARSRRYVALGRATRVRSASTLLEGQVGNDYNVADSASVVHIVDHYLGSMALARTAQATATAAMPGVASNDRGRRVRLLEYSTRLSENSDAIFFGGGLNQGQLLADAAAVAAARAASGTWDFPPLSVEAKQELTEFGGMLFDGGLGVAEDTAAEELGKLRLGVEALGMVTGAVRDFVDFNVSLGRYIQDRSRANELKVAELGMKFGFGLTAGCFATAAASIAGLPLWGGAALALAGAVGADYAARALIAHEALRRPGARKK